MSDFAEKIDKIFYGLNSRMFVIRRRICPCQEQEGFSLRRFKSPANLFRKNLMGSEASLLSKDRRNRGGNGRCRIGGAVEAFVATQMLDRLGKTLRND